MPSKLFSAAITGIDAMAIEIETEVSYGLRVFDIVGLPDKAIEESKERIGVALKNSGFKSPRTQPLRVLVNLAPADIKKEGTLYDLPIALGFLLASHQLSFDPQGKLVVGELSLDGRVKPVRGALAFSILGRTLGYKEIILPKENAKEAAMGAGNALKIIGVETLTEAVSYLKGALNISPLQFSVEERRREDMGFPFSLIRGQAYAKRALEIAAAGSHNILLQGPPGTGKTLLAKALASLLPPLEPEESLEVTKIYSISGLLPPQEPLIVYPPFRSPHHTTSEVALIGGGNPPRPGEITLAHRGVLFLDEFPEFHRDVLESLRQPIEEGEITLLRSKQQLTLPARFLLVAATNPCPCGYYRDPNRACVCSPSSIQKYRRKLSGPLIDRIDMIIDVPQVTYEELASSDPREIEKEKAMRERVKQARKTQYKRFQKAKTNSQMEISEIKNCCTLDSKSGELLQKYVDAGKLSARGYHRVLKVARTIADLAQSQEIRLEHISEALSYRIREE